MKRIVFLLTLTVAVSFAMLFQACQSSKSSTASKMLKFNLEKGRGYDYEMTMNMDQEIMGQPMQMDMSSYYSMDVKEDEGENKVITTSISRFKLKTSIRGMNIEIDTDNPLKEIGDSSGAENPIRMMNRVLSAIRGREFSMKVSPEGKVIEVTGLEKMSKDLADSLGLSDSDKAEMMKAFDKQFNPDQIKSQMDRFWYIFPNKEVKVGDSWQKTSELGGPMPGKYNSTYKVTEIEGDMVTLDENTQIDSKQEKMGLKGTMKGTLVVDSRSGLVVNADQDMKLTAEAGGMSFDINGKTKIKGKAR